MTDKPGGSLFTTEVEQAVKAYQDRKGLDTWTEAVVQLVKIGLRVESYGAPSQVHSERRPENFIG